LWLLRQVGIDDFALKEGDHYGKFLVDLSRHVPVDPAFYWSTESATWLLAYPGMEFISRDRTEI
jgi:hypothetical protein